MMANNSRILHVGISCGLKHKSCHLIPFNSSYRLFIDTTLKHLSNFDAYSVYIYYWARRAISRESDCRFRTMRLILAWSHNLDEFDHEIFSTVILLLLLIQERLCQLQAKGM